MPEPLVESTPATRSRHWPRLVAFVWRVVSVRLRFLIVLGAAFALVAEWDVVTTYWDRLTHGSKGADAVLQAVSTDTEYFCPMDPGVLSDWPGKCGICNMALVRRKRGDATPLPDGVVARMQFSPYRLQLAGIRTAPVEYQALAREVEGPGRVTSAGAAEVDLFPSEAGGLVIGQEAEILGLGPQPTSARLEAIQDSKGPSLTARLALNGPPNAIRTGQEIRARIRVPMATAEPFRSQPRDVPPLRPGEPRRYYTCAEHPEILREKAGTCPTDGKPLGRRNLAANQRLRWWCPMHPDVTADVTGKECAACEGMKLVPRVVAFAPKGQVLAVPEAAVVDTGTRRVAYVERMPGMFDGVEVVLGPRCGEFYPVVRGLEPGQRVVTSGAFLVDAESRLNPSLAAGYFGAARREEPAVTPESGTDPDEELPAEDRARVARQGTCPVTGKKLGSMGTPTRLVVSGRTLYLCCEGCEPKLRQDPARYLAKLPPEPAGKPDDARRVP